MYSNKVMTPEGYRPRFTVTVTWSTPPTFIRFDITKILLCVYAMIASLELTIICVI